MGFDWDALSRVVPLTWRVCRPLAASAIENIREQRDPMEEYLAEKGGDRLAAYRAANERRDQGYRRGYLEAPDRSLWTCEGDLWRGTFDLHNVGLLEATSPTPWEPAEWLRVVREWDGPRRAAYDRDCVARAAAYPADFDGWVMRPGWFPVEVGSMLDPRGNAWSWSNLSGKGGKFVPASPKDDGEDIDHYERERTAPTPDAYEANAAELDRLTEARRLRLGVEAEADQIVSALSRWIQEPEKARPYKYMGSTYSKLSKWGKSAVGLARYDARCVVLMRAGVDGRGKGRGGYASADLLGIAVVVPDGSGWACYAVGAEPDPEALSGLTLAVMEGGTPVGPFEARPDLKLVQERGFYLGAVAP